MNHNCKIGKTYYKYSEMGYKCDIDNIIENMSKK